MVAAGAPPWVRALRIGFGVLGVVALVWIPVRDLGASTFSLGNYLSYFTIESNILGVVVLLVGGLCDPRNLGWQLVRGAGALYLLITGLVYAVLLSGADVMLRDRWIDDILHRVLPIVLVADWLLIPARLAVRAGLVAGWLGYPAAYGVYSLVRGELVDWYPYPFLDPRVQGYPSVLIGFIVLAAVFTLLAVALAGAGMLFAGRGPAGPAGTSARTDGYGRPGHR
ncbi:Pr6Pr family membrane protein [Nocardia sp. BMG51109]|uniref:Pr6Pr family membrane protein n=1 Tax=Nocardia sp. BMG51109 TaxID=1056816 RepID=UPI0004642D73|nr:Pr6Pr family membrane protein [Nocardia sp. BMG51109]